MLGTSSLLPNDQAEPLSNAQSKKKLIGLLVQNKWIELNHAPYAFPEVLISFGTTFLTASCFPVH